MKPKINIDVDPETGVWSSDGLSMIYAPRHWIVGIHKDVETAVGRNAYLQLMYQTGYGAAQHWCDQQSKLFGLSGLDLFRHYLGKSSDRGLANFSLLLADLEGGRIEIGLRNSCYVLHHRQFSQGKPSSATECFAFTGSFTGAADWIARDQGIEHRFIGRERECAAQTGREACVIEIVAKDVA